MSFCSDVFYISMPSQTKHWWKQGHLHEHSFLNRQHGDVLVMKTKVKHSYAHQSSHSWLSHLSILTFSCSCVHPSIHQLHKCLSSVTVLRHCSQFGTTEYRHSPKASPCFGPLSLVLLPAFCSHSLCRFQPPPPTYISIPAPPTPYASLEFAGDFKTWW